jgi:ribonuclease J
MNEDSQNKESSDAAIDRLAGEGLSAAPKPQNQAQPPSQGGRGRNNSGGGGNSNRGRSGGRGGMSRMKRSGRPAGPMRSTSNGKPEDVIPPVGENIRIIPLGGVEEIGKNMTAIEMGNDIVIIDAGFQFKEEDTPGIDYILPNTRYLEERKDRIRAILITHGHLDHIGSLPFIMDRIGNPPLYTRNLTSLMIKKRQAEFPHLAPIDYKIVEGNDQIRIGDISVRFFGVTHSIPDAMGIIIDTPYGMIVTPGDYKLTHMDGVVDAEEEKEYAYFDGKKVLCLLTDSTNIENPGFSTPEATVNKNLEEIIKNIKGRLIMAMFASHVYRIANVVRICEKYGKKLVIEGRSMKNNIEMIMFAGILTVDKNVIIKPEDIDNYPPDKVVVLATGAQGEDFSFLDRLVTGAYKHFKLNERDTILLSSSIVPGNEKSVQRLKDGIARSGARIVHYRTSDVYIHSTGHGNRGEIEWLHKKIKAKFFIPIHGSHYMLKLHAELARELGMPKENIIVPDNGMIIEIQDKGEKIVALKEKAPSQQVMVDGFTVGDIQEVVLRDRKKLSEDGIFVIVSTVDAKTGKLRKSPDIISRGSIYLRESQELLREVRHVIKRTIERNIPAAMSQSQGGGNANGGPGGQNQPNFDHVKDLITEEVSRFLFQNTAKEPIVIPVINSF